jgi:DNA sulfur modification protein DndD
MTNAIQDLGANHKDAAKRQRGLAAKDRAAQSYVHMAERTEAAIENTEADIRLLTSQHDDMNREIQSLDKALRATAGVESEIQRLQDIQSNIWQIKEDLAKLEEERKDLLAHAWGDLVDPVVSRRIEELRKEQESHIHSLEKIGEIRSRLKQIEELQSSKVCPTCGQAYPEYMFHGAERDHCELQIELEGLQLDQDRLAYLGDAIRKLSRVKTRGVATSLERLEDAIRRGNVNLVGLENKRHDIQKKLEGYNQAAIAENRHRYNQLLKRLGAVEVDIKEKQGQLQRLRSEAADYQNKITQASGPQLARLNREVSIYESLLGIFKGAVVRLRDQLKIDVERDASEVFLQLTTDSTYERLRINERYGLSILREGGREVLLRSAGAEQIVALSLISALNRNAVRRGPVIMDTPFGRLDPTHRANVLTFVPRMAHQVVLLVHSGEIDRGPDVGLISQIRKRRVRNQADVRG